LAKTSVCKCHLGLGIKGTPGQPAGLVADGRPDAVVRRLEQHVRVPDLYVAAISATSIVTVVSAAFTAVAAAATVVAVVYARRTVGEAHLARTESRAAHEGEIAALEQATALAAEQHKQQIREQQFAASAAYAGHEEQMAAQKEVFRHDLIVRRLVQMQRVAQVLFRSHRSRT
jgi:hypothetical protein